MNSAVALLMLLSLGQQPFVGSSPPDFQPDKILARAFSGAATEALVEALNGPPYTFGSNWGNQITTRTADGGRWVWEGAKSHFETHYREDNRNDGVWTRGSISLEDPAHEMIVNFSDFKATPRLLEVSFQIYARAMLRAQAEARSYRYGVELGAISTGARAVVSVNLTLRVYLYDNATRLGWQVVAPDLSYSDVTLDKLGYMGGEAAKVLGDAITGSIKQFFSSQRAKMLANIQNRISAKLNGSLPIRNDLAMLIRIMPH